MPSGTPRVIIIRHGETEWTLNGRHTSRTDLPLTPDGEKRIRATGNALVGEEKLISPSRIAHIYVSPRLRANRTLELLGIFDKDPHQREHATVTDQLEEWYYGQYEGLTNAQIHESRRESGLDLDRMWDIWKDGCEGGESPADVERRCDALIETIRNQWHGPAMRDGNVPGDVVCVAHGHLLRAFVMRWVRKSLSDNTVPLVLEVGGIGTLSYQHNSMDEPAILLGGSFGG